MTIENEMNLLTRKTDCMLYYAETASADKPCEGWIGGNAPEFFDNPANFIHEKDQAYLFYLSLVHPFQTERMISIFVPEDYDAYLEHNKYPNCPIKVLEHPVSTESLKDTYTNTALQKHHISVGELCHDEDSMERSFLIKVGGAPRLIQNEEYYFAKLKEEDFSFFFQVDEDGYPDSLLQENGSYPFGYGALYIFAHIGTAEIKHLVAGFWQFS